MYVHYVPLTSPAYYNPQDSWSSYRSVPLSHEPRTQDGQYEFAHLHVPDMYIQLYPDKIDINEAEQTATWRITKLAVYYTLTQVFTDRTLTCYKTMT